MNYVTPSSDLRRSDISSPLVSRGGIISRSGQRDGHVMGCNTFDVDFYQPFFVHNILTTSFFPIISLSLSVCVNHLSLTLYTTLHPPHTKQHNYNNSPTNQSINHQIHSLPKSPKHAPSSPQPPSTWPKTTVVS